ncbi:unnamed protein product [Lactuca virosa]|uniref:Uncharacterized protein n=1 Tax=Lactuca virosa TaxID=75947 RepID=A0AAU9MBV3_9ASTR|nr:unnamed protein product [Lactuca virosa]
MKLSLIFSYSTHALFTPLHCSVDKPALILLRTTPVSHQHSTTTSTLRQKANNSQPLILVLHHKISPLD